VWLVGLSKLKKFIHLIGSLIHNLPVCSIMPQPLRYSVLIFNIQETSLSHNVLLHELSTLTCYYKVSLKVISEQKLISNNCRKSTVRQSTYTHKEGQMKGGGGVH
jgi:hypothetical protein